MKRVHVILLALIAILLVAVVFAPVPGDTRWIRTLHNSAHAPIFGCISLLVLLLIRSHPRFQLFGLAWQYALALAVAFALGVATELMQIAAGRDASFEDALHDTVGALAFLGVFAAFDSRLRDLPRGPQLRFGAGILGAACSIIAVAPVATAAMKYQQRDDRFPVLADFSQHYDRYFILQQSAEFSPMKMPAPWAKASDEGALRVRLLDGSYPGMSFIELLPDWTKYSALALDLTNPTPLNLLLVVRVHDRGHDNQPEDRFSERLELPAGTRQVFRIPLQRIAAGPKSRALDLRQVSGLIIFRSEDSPAAGELYLSQAWLE
jgi:hypothetical protein